MAEATSSIKRAANVSRAPVSTARRVLETALDVDEITETLAREHWDRLPMVAKGEMPRWELIGDDDGWPEVKFTRDRCRPFAEAVRNMILGEG